MVQQDQSTQSLFDIYTIGATSIQPQYTFPLPELPTYIYWWCAAEERVSLNTLNRYAQVAE